VRRRGEATALVKREDSERVLIDFASSPEGRGIQEEKTTMSAFFVVQFRE
jgi:hypothetical protein